MFKLLGVYNCTLELSFPLYEWIGSSLHSVKTFQLNMSFFTKVCLFVYFGGSRAIKDDHAKKFLRQAYKKEEL